MNLINRYTTRSATSIRPFKLYLYDAKNHITSVVLFKEDGLSVVTEKTAIVVKLRRTWDVLCYYSDGVLTINLENCTNGKPEKPNVWFRLMVDCEYYEICY